MLWRTKNLGAFLSMLLLTVYAQNSSLRITAPANGAEVPHRPMVEGKVEKRDARVWVVVHPMADSSYYVQQPATVENDGTWAVQVYIGDAGHQHVGQIFEVVAFANPKTKLDPKDLLGSWPDAQWRSQVVRVKRK